MELSERRSQSNWGMIRDKKKAISKNSRRCRGSTHLPRSQLVSDGMEATASARYRKSDSVNLIGAGAPRTHDLSDHPPSEKMHLRFEGVKRTGRFPAGSITVVPAGSSLLWRRQGSMDSLIIYLERAWSRGRSRVIRIRFNPDGGATAGWLERA